MEPGMVPGASSIGARLKGRHVLWPVASLSGSRCVRSRIMMLHLCLRREVTKNIKRKLASRPIPWRGGDASPTPHQSSTSAIPATDMLIRIAQLYTEYAQRIYRRRYGTPPPGRPTFGVLIVDSCKPDAVANKGPTISVYRCL